MRKLARLLPYLAVLVLAAIAALVILHAGPVAEHLRKVIASELGRQTDREISIGSASFTLSGRVRLREVVVRNRDGSPLLTAPQVTARVGREGSWLPLLSGLTEVREVRVVEPEVALTRDAEGAWNIADLVARKPEKPSRFRGDIVVEHGRLVFVDEARGGVATVIEGADFTLGYPEPGRTVFSLRAGGSGGAFAGVELEGETDAKGGVTRVSGSVSDLDLRYALARLPEIEAVSVSGGRADVKGEVLLGGGNPEGGGVSYDVRLAVRDGEVGFPWLRRPAEDVHGEVRFADGQVPLLDVAATVGSARVSVAGAIADLGHPSLDLEVSASGIRYPRMKTLLPRLVLPPELGLPSPLQVTARVKGPVSDVTVTGDATAPVIEFRGVPWKTASAEFEYSSGRLKLTDLRAHGSPRRAEGEGTVAWDEGRTTFEGDIDLTDVPLSLLAQMVGMEDTDVQGTGSVKMHAESDEGVSISGDFDLRDAVVRGLDMGTVEGEFKGAADSIRVDGCVFGGSVGSGCFSATASLPGLSSIEAEFSWHRSSRLSVSGVFDGKLGALWDTRALTGSGRMELGPGELEGRAFESLSATISVSPARVQVSDLVLLMGKGEYRSESLKLTNWLGGWQRAPISGRLTVAGAQVGEWVPPEYAAEVPEGRVDGEIELSGTVADPRVTLDLRLTALTVAGQPFKAGGARIRYEEGRLIVKELFLDDPNDPGTHVAASGSYDPETGLALAVCAYPLDLSRFDSGMRERYGLAVEGEVSGLAALAGPLDDPRVKFRADSDSLNVNGETLEKVTVSGQLDRDVLEVESGVVRAGAGTISVCGRVNRRAGELDVSAKLEELDLGRLYTAGYLAVWRLASSGVRSPYFATYAKVPHPLEGRLTADVAIKGSIREPRVALSGLALEGLGYAGRRISSIDGDLTLGLRFDDGGLVLREAEVDLTASDEMGDATISTWVGPEGKLTLVFNSVGYLDLSLLGPWLPYPVDVEGQATINFNVEDPLGERVVYGDVLVDGLRIGPFAAEQVMVSPIRLEESVLTLEQIRFTNPPIAGHPPLEGFGRASFPLFPGKGGLRGLAGPEAELELKMGSGKLKIGGNVVLRRPAPADWREHKLDVKCEFDEAEIVIPGVLTAKLDGALLLTNEAEDDPRERAGWLMLEGAVGTWGPFMSVVTEEMRQQIYGRPRALVKTNEGEPLVLSEATVVVPKLGVVPGLGAAVLAPKVKVEVLVGSAEGEGQGPGDAGQIPTKIAVDLGLLGFRGPATGKLELGGELSLKRYVLDGEMRAEDGVVAFPNAVLALRWGTLQVLREEGAELEVRISNAEAVGRVGEYNITLRPAGQVYPFEEAGSGGEGTGPALPLNVTTIPYLEPGLAMALLWGPVVAPTRGGGQSGQMLLAEPGSGVRGTGEITGVMLPAWGGGVGSPALSLDVALQGPVRMRVGQSIFRRVLITYVSAVSGPEETRSLGVTYEIVPPLLSVGWGVDERDRTRWELQGFRSF